MSKTWDQLEDEKYSWLYENGYPKGNPEGLCSRFNIPSTMKAIDLGCGLGSLSNYFSDYTGVDVSEFVIKKCKETRKGTFYHSSLHKISEVCDDEFDIAICADVMEHIPPEEVDNILSSISKVKAQRFAFAISTRPSGILDKDGNNLHLTIQDDESWLGALTQHFNTQYIESANDTLFVLGKV